MKAQSMALNNENRNVARQAVTALREMAASQRMAVCVWRHGGIISRRRGVAALLSGVA